MGKRQRRVRSFSIIASLLMVFSLMAPGITSAEAKSKELHRSVSDSNSVAKVKMSDRLMDEFTKDDMVTFLIKFKEKVELDKVVEEVKSTAKSANMTFQKAEHLQRSKVISELKATSFESQQNVQQFLEQAATKGHAKNIHSYYIVNGMAVTATKEIAQKVAAFAEVEKILPNETRKLLETEVSDNKLSEADVEDDEIEWNVDRVGAPAVWEMGIDGTGTVVGSLDTGAQWDHPALKEQYRGYDGENVDHQYSWYDASGGEAEPYDDHGHGSHVTGTMTGAEPDGTNHVGVAPGAKWISAKVFDAGGSTTDAILLDAAEWMLAPGGNVDMAPDVVNNSWGGGPGIDEWYMDTVDAWRAANIFPAFAAGNVDLFNPGGPESVVTPANYPQSFAVGNTDRNDMISSSSLRGPSPYDEIKPDVSAPGSGIRSSVPEGEYGGMSGTSMATPAVSGVVALLRSASGNLSVDAIEEILTNTAVARTDDEYPESPNNGYGYGIVNAYDAVNSTLDGLGVVEGTVSKDGEDNEAPTYNHESPATTYAGMDLDLLIEARDNVSVSSVELEYQDNDGDTQTMEAARVSGDYMSGEYAVTIPEEDIGGDSLTYKWIINDYGDNEVTTEAYSVDVQEGISVGYEEDFESTPVGWTSFGEEDSWEWGEPTSGPESAASGEKVYATNLDGDYAGNMNATLVMPPIDLPEGDAFLQFNQWYDLEAYDSGNAYDFAHVFVSTDMEEWEQLERMEGESDGWGNKEVDLSDFSGQRIYIGFNLDSDSSINREGWYIDDVALTDTSESSKASLMNNNQVGLNGISGVGLNNGMNTMADAQVAVGSGFGLGVIKNVEKAPMKEKVDADNIKPEMTKKDNPPVKENNVNPAALPLGAQVTVLESDRAVNTNPEDGSYSLTHPSGTFTVQADAYGFHEEEENVTIESDETVEVNFTLDEIDQATVSGTITDEATGDPIEGATISLVEDANVAPVESDGEGNYSLTAYEGEYTLKVMARNYHSKNIDITLEDGDIVENIELDPFYTFPGGEIGYDDGTAENARQFYDAGNGWAVKMSLPEGKDSAIVTDGVFKFWNEEFPDPGGTEFEVEVWDAGDDGMPGEKLAGPIDAEAVRDETDWTVVDLSEHNIIVEDDFYMVYVQTQDDPLAPGLATDESSPNAERSYQLVSGSWEQSPADEGNYMIRSRVSYEVEEPVITSPANDDLTSETEITVEGTASPTTSVQLMNNEEEVGSAEVGEDGAFAIPTELEEGANELTAVTLLEGDFAGESEPVTVTLDTTAPELTIDNPKDGDKTNRETVTVEGTADDANLDYVEVNGQKADVSDGNYSKRILLDNGENEIEVTAMDEAGNETTKSVTLNVKYNAPVIENLTPTEDVYLETGKTVKFEFDSEPGLRATFFIHMPLTNQGAKVANATELPMMEMSDGHYVGYWTVPSGVTADGAVIEVRAVDSFKNDTRKEAEGKLFINVDEE